MNRRLLITGAGGFLGSRICEYYSNRDGYEAVGVTHRELDIEDFVAAGLCPALCGNFKHRYM